GRLEQVLEPLVGVVGGAEAGELAHGPEAAAVPLRVEAAGVRVLAGFGDIAVDGLERLCGLGRAVGRLEDEPGDGDSVGVDVVEPGAGDAGGSGGHARTPSGPIWWPGGVYTGDSSGVLGLGVGVEFGVNTS